MIKRILKQIADRVFLRSTIARTQKDLVLVDKRLQYLLAKIDAYAEVDDRNNVVLLEELRASQESTKARLAAMERAQAENAINLVEAIEKIALNEFRQREALDALSRLLKLDLPLPATRRSAASPDFLLYLYRHIVASRPQVIVELGSGVSTLVAAAALKANGEGRLHSLDHLASYSEATSRNLAQYDLEELATVYFAPLATWQPAKSTELGEEWQWYSVPKSLASVGPIDLLVVDGPPQGKNDTSYARYPAVPYFHARMSPGCVVLLDDGARQEEKAIANAWSAEWDMKLDYHRLFEKGLAILTIAAIDPPAAESPEMPRPAGRRRVRAGR